MPLQEKQKGKASLTTVTRLCVPESHDDSVTMTLHAQYRISYMEFSHHLLYYLNLYFSYCNVKISSIKKTDHDLISSKTTFFMKAPAKSPGWFVFLEIFLIYKT